MNDLPTREITNEDKLKAIEGLRNDIGEYTNSQKMFNAKLDRSINLLRKNSLITMFILVISFAVGGYLILRPRPATQMDMEHIRRENENLTNRMKLFEYQKEDFRKEKELFVVLKAKTDSDINARRQDIVRMMSAIYKQDSLKRYKAIK